ncbi:DUF6193 family natural product biosynthesis protein [Streptomyces sp. NPDC015532]|uniref:DUF6193 family natural product biosynthesis protein n=1 Tax=Streptomyces sp. NPDC015532 TaxID=3364960 RepID=UPI0036F91384
MLLPLTELPRTQIIERTRHRHEHIHRLLDKRWTVSAIARRLNLDRKSVRRIRYTDLDELLASARERLPNGVLEPFKAYLNARFTEGQGQVSSTRVFLEIQARGYPGSRQVVRKHLAVLRSGTAEPSGPTPRAPARSPRGPCGPGDARHVWPSLVPTSSDTQSDPAMIFVIRAPVSGNGGDTMTVDANDETCDRQLPLPPRPVLPDITAARSRDPADVVEAHWQSLQLSWQWKHAVHQIRSPGRPYPGIVPLLEAAAAQPRLRRLCPFTSHFALCFSSSTNYPWTVRAGSIEPLDNGRFKVRRRGPSAVIGEVATAEEALALVLELLPTGPAPPITASADEHV